MVAVVSPRRRKGKRRKKRKKVGGAGAAIASLLLQLVKKAKKKKKDNKKLKIKKGRKEKFSNPNRYSNLSLQCAIVVPSRSQSSNNHRHQTLAQLRCSRACQLDFFHPSMIFYGPYLPDMGLDFDRSLESSWQALHNSGSASTFGDYDFGSLHTNFLIFGIYFT